MAEYDDNDGHVKLDTTELWVAHNISYITRVSRNNTENVLREVFHAITSWASSPKCIRDFKPESEFFYLYYSIVLHLGAAAEASIELQHLGVTNTSKFIRANRTFIECCSRLTSILDLLAQILEACDGRIDLSDKRDARKYDAKTESFN